jgi:hypothetical protein
MQEPGSLVERLRCFAATRQLFDDRRVDRVCPRPAQSGGEVECRTLV